MIPDYQQILDHILIDADDLQARISALGAEISRDYQGKKDVLLVGILKGCMLFMTDLMRSLTIPNAIDFMDVASYGAGVRETSGDVRILMDLHTSITGRDVLIVEDIVDSGRTLHKVVNQLRARQPASLEIVTLLDKEVRREVDVRLKYTGFVIPDEFVFGYGLDIDEYYRNLPFIGVVKKGVVIGE